MVDDTCHVTYSEAKGVAEMIVYPSVCYEHSENQDRMDRKEDHILIKLTKRLRIQEYVEDWR